MSETVMAARPGTISVTPEGGGAVTITDVTEWEPIDDPEMIKDMSGESQRAYYYQGELQQGIKFTTGDMNVQDKLSQGMFFSTASAGMKCVKRADGTQKVSGNVLVTTLTNGIVHKLGKPKSDTSGKPSRWEVILLAAHSSTGTEGSGTSVVTLS
jgi:hypothetical protein